MKRLIAALVLTLAVGVAVATAGSTAVPILTGPNAFNAKGFGQVKPTTIFLGGDPTGLVCRIHWLTWGGALAVGTGVGWTINSHESVAEGAPALAVVVLSRLGTWHGRPAYKSWTWYFPEGRSGFHPAVCEIDGHPA